MTESNLPQVEQPQRKPGRWKRRLKWTALVMTVVLGVVLALIDYMTKDYVRTLRSLRRVAGTNCYVMDYYVDYHIDKIQADGMDVNHIEDSFISTLFPEPVASIAMDLKKKFIEKEVHTIDAGDHHCSTVVLQNDHGETFFGRNFDWMHNACLILKIHKGDVVTSVTVIDLAYLNLDRPDLEKSGLVKRIPLLFAPYYVMDGMNRHGVAISGMSLRDSKAPYDPTKPDVTHSTAMRLVLDEAKTTGQALEIFRRYNIHFIDNSCHLMIADTGGHSVVVEFIDGEMKVIETDENWQVCTNHQICGKTEADNDACCGRYRSASAQLAALPGSSDEDDMMRIMGSVSQNDWTMWTSVYNLSTGEFQVLHRKSPQDNEYQGQLTMVPGKTP